MGGGALVERSASFLGGVIADSSPGFQVGLGYRRALHQELMEAPEGLLDFVELAPENYLGLGGEWRRRLAAISDSLYGIPAPQVTPARFGVGTTGIKVIAIHDLPDLIDHLFRAVGDRTTDGTGKTQPRP